MSLKHCPFCGAKAMIGKFLVGCTKCSLFLSFHPKVDSQKESAVKKWNQRWQEI